MDSNIPKSIFYSAIAGEFLRIARSSSQLDFFIPKAKELLLRMKNQGAKPMQTRACLRKMIGRHDCFAKFSLLPSDLIKTLFP